MPIAPNGVGATADQSATPPSGAPGASPSTLAGEDPDPTSGAQAQPSGDEGLKQVVQTIRQLQMQMMDLAKQFPAAASSLRTAATGLRAAMRQIVSNPGSPEPPAPNIGG